MAKKTLKVVEKKQEKVTKDTELNVVNFIFEIFTGNSPLSMSIMKLKRNVKGAQAYNLYKYINKIILTPEHEAYKEVRKELIEAFNKEQEKKEEKDRIMASPASIPEWGELLNQESGIKLDKMVINLSDLIPDMSNIYMSRLQKEQAKSKPNEEIVENLEQQILMERERILVDDDFRILAEFFIIN
jgi:hypothetical protein